MRKDRNKALKLRLRGYSYNEITRAIGVPKSTLSGWFTCLELSEKARARIHKRVALASLRGLTRKNKMQTHAAKQRALFIRQSAKKDIQQLSPRELMIVGATLYWAEGYKRSIVKNNKERTYHPVSLTNSDPNLIKIFLKFLRKICGIDDSKIYADIRIFEHINADEALKYWLKTTQLPKDNFRKLYYGVSKSSKHKRPFNRLPYGTIQIRANDTKKFHQIMGWIEALKCARINIKPR